MIKNRERQTRKSQIQEKAEEVLSVLAKINSQIDGQNHLLDDIIVNIYKLEKSIKSDKDLRNLRLDRRIKLNSFLKTVQITKSQLFKASRDLERVCASHKDSSWIPEESVFE